MTVLRSFNEDRVFEVFDEIRSFLHERGIFIERWEANQSLTNESSQEEILKAYDHKIGPFMKESGYQSADVISVNPQTENIEAIRQKFLKEHTHSEDEVRFFVDGEGLFWFHYDRVGKDEVFNILCQKGDFLSVPQGYKHWFDLAPKYTVKAIRIFTSQEGWVANYTESGIDEKYNPK